MVKKRITEEDIIEYFLLDSQVDSPQDFIKQICNCSTAFLPVYYYIQLSNISKEETIKMISQVTSRSQAKKKLIERLSQNKREYQIFSSTAMESTKKKLAYKKMFINENLVVLKEEQNVLYCIQAIRYLTDKEIVEHRKYIKNTLLVLFQTHYANAKQSLADSFRRAFCRIDEAEWAEKEGNK